MIGALTLARAVESLSDEILARRETPLERRGSLVEASVGAAEGHFGLNRSSDQPG
jgi:hypothetical protein